MKNYTLIVSGHNSFSLSNDTDSDSQTDYFPGIWALKSQKSALRFARQEIAEGNKVRVTDYNEAKNHKLANYFIKELGIDQPLFPEPVALISHLVTNGMPSTLGALKKFLTVGKKLHVINFDYEGKIRNEIDTVVLTTQSNAITVEKTPGSQIKSWIQFEKATDWTFSNTAAVYSYMDRDGKWIPSIRIEYLSA